MYDIITNNTSCFARKKPDYDDKYYKRVQKLSTDSWESQEPTAACCANYFFLYCSHALMFFVSGMQFISKSLSVHLGHMDLPQSK